jgi:hypothetical protein
VHISYSLSDSSISVILPPSEVVEMSSDWRVLPVRIRRIIVVEVEWLARICSRNHVMEDSESISSHRVSRVISELSYSIILRANILVSIRADSMSLKIIPEAISI